MFSGPFVTSPVALALWVEQGPIKKGRTNGSGAGNEGEETKNSHHCGESPFVSTV
jgi:hypothetical protein